MKKSILYCGDDTLENGACYLFSIIKNSGYDIDYCPSNKRINNNAISTNYDLYIFSDFPVKNIDYEMMEQIKENVKTGASFMMIGGWESFFGKDGEYLKTPFEDILPVNVLNKDDRLNYCQGLVPVPVITDHAITRGLPWVKPPVICGCNIVKIKPNAETIMILKKIIIKNSLLQLDNSEIPYIATWKYGKGKTIAITSDFSPHWVGGMLDWGTKRRTLNINKNISIEVGDYYIKFIQNLLKYVLC